MKLPCLQRLQLFAMIEVPQEWYVVFSSRTKNVRWSWWHIFTRPGFEHAAAFTYSPDKALWIYVDWASNGLHILLLSSVEMSDTVDVFKFHDARFVRMTKVDRVSVPWFTSVYCVSAIRHILGISGWTFMTPYFLYRKIIKLGGEIINHHPVWGKFDNG